MSIDLMQMIKGAVTQQVMSKIGGVLGMEPKKASSAFDTGAAALLGGILKKASSPEGAKSVFDLAKNTDFSVLDKLGDMIGGSGAAAEQFQKSGGGLLDTLLGGNKSGMFSVLTKALGLDSSILGKLMAMVAPIVMGILGKQIKSQGLDAMGFSNLLSSQKQSLAGFLPGNLVNDLGFSSLMGNVGKAASEAANMASSAATGAVNTASNATRQVANAGEKAGGGLLKILLPLLLIAALGFLLWKFVFSGAAQDTVNKAGNAVTSTAQDAVDKAGGAVKGVADTAADAANAIADKANEVKDAVIEGLPKFDMDISALGETGNVLKTGFGDITTGLANLAKEGTSEDSARSLLEKINEFSGKIDGMGLDKLEGAGKTASQGLIGAFLGSLDGLLAKIPAPLRAIVEPAVKSLIDKLNPFK